MPRANLASLLDDVSDDEPAGEHTQPPQRGKLNGNPGAEPPLLPGPVTGPTSIEDIPTGESSRPSGFPANEPAAAVSAGPATPVASTQSSAAQPIGPATPRYLQLERKELRIRLDQADLLAQLTRRLNRARRGTGERITDNTLIRVAIDLLLQNSDRLVGTTEDQLRNSVSQ